MRLVVLAAGHDGSFTWSGTAGIVLVFLVVALPGCPPRQRPATGGLLVPADAPQIRAGSPGCRGICTTGAPVVSVASGHAHPEHALRRPGVRPVSDLVCGA
ncbi:MAG: hypothetical protein M3P95_00580 [Actinomycetota bacterium]|nr:hypothetical protein [Actinomycetota bacterium]